MKVINRKEKGVLRRTIEVTQDDIARLHVAIDCKVREIVSTIKELEESGSAEALEALPVWEKAFEEYNKALDDLSAENWIWLLENDV